MMGLVSFRKKAPEACSEKADTGRPGRLSLPEPHHSGTPISESSLQGCEK